MNVLRVRIDLKDVDPNVDVSEVARRVGEIIRNMTGSEVSITVKDNDPVDKRK